MLNPQFSKPWHGIPRASIDWNPTVIEDVCIGCGTCVSGCSRLVYRFDFARKKPVVLDPLNCMVGCTTCANTCPTHAIAFPAISAILDLEKLSKVHHEVEDDLLARRDNLASTIVVPHPDRIVPLVVTRIDRHADDVLCVTLEPVTPGECFCEFLPGQYIELWRADAVELSRAYSIANAPHGDGSILLHIRRVMDGRFTRWAFDKMRVGDRLLARGPLGAFTMRSAHDAALMFIAGGTGLAPVLALIEQQVNFAPSRDMLLLWGVRRSTDFYALDTLQALLARAPNLHVLLAAASVAPASRSATRFAIKQGDVMDILRDDENLLDARDIYSAGPTAMLREVARYLDERGVAKERQHMDSFGV